MKALAIVIGLVLLGCGSGAEVRAPSPSPVLEPVTFEELVRGSVPTEVTADGNPVGDRQRPPSAAPFEAHDARVDERPIRNRDQGGSTPPVGSNTSALTEADLYGLLAASPWPESEWTNVVSVATCESRLRPDAEGDGGASLGLMQIRLPSWPRLARSFDLKDPRQNLVAAYVAWLEAGGWWPWSCRP